MVTRRDRCHFTFTSHHFTKLFPFCDFENNLLPRKGGRETLSGLAYTPRQCLAVLCSALPVYAVAWLLFKCPAFETSVVSLLHTRNVAGAGLGPKAPELGSCPDRQSFWVARCREAGKSPPITNMVGICTRAVQAPPPGLWHKESYSAGCRI